MGYAKRELIQSFARMMELVRGKENKAEVMVQVLAGAGYAVLLLMNRHLGKIQELFILWKGNSANGD